MDVFLCFRCRRGKMSPQLNLRNSLQNPERLNLPRPTLTTHLTGTPLRLGHVVLTCPLVASHPHFDHFQKALLQHPAPPRALPQQPLTHLPSALLHPSCPKGLNPRTREWRDSPHRITQSLWSLVSISKNIHMQTKVYRCASVFSS